MHAYLALRSFTFNNPSSSIDNGGSCYPKAYRLRVLRHSLTASTWQRSLGDEGQLLVHRRYYQWQPKIMLGLWLVSSVTKIFGAVRSLICFYTIRSWQIQHSVIPSSRHGTRLTSLLVQTWFPHWCEVRLDSGANQGFARSLLCLQPILHDFIRSTLTCELSRCLQHVCWNVKEPSMRCVLSLTINLHTAHQDTCTRQHFRGPVVFHKCVLGDE